MSENGVFYLIVAFVLAEGINVWACWLPAPYGADAIDPETLKRGQKAATVFTVGYGAAASLVTGNLLPVIIAIGFSAMMHVIWEHENAKNIAKGAVKDA